MITRYKAGRRMSRAVAAAGVLSVAGEVADGRKASIGEQTRDVLGKVDAFLREAGTDRSKLLAVNVFRPNIADFEPMNAVYDGWVDRANPPARACFEARLADPDLRVEITATAPL